ncbi:MAG: type II secretion system protein GspG [Bdellovibrionales bacterium]|nr:type II secretion system protein GspG [Bdellovibrionales bacterium]
MKTLSPRSELGLTLVEIMVVLVILGLLGTFLFGQIFGAGEQAKARMNNLKMEQLAGKLDEYRLMYNSLPNSLDDLTGCNEQTGPGCIPLLDRAKGQEMLNDAWGNPFKYTKGGNGRTYAITSLGADGQPGGEGLNFDFKKEGP